MLMTRETASKLLNLKENASKEDIEFQYMDIAMMNHPYRKSSNLKTTKIFKDIGIAYKRLQQSSDEDWVEQFNSMDLFHSVYGDYSESEFDEYDNDDDSDTPFCGGSICRHCRCAFCCPFCNSDDYFPFTPEEYDSMKKKADRVAEELMKEEVEEKKKACQRKEKKSKLAEKKLTEVNHLNSLKEVKKLKEQNLTKTEKKNSSKQVDTSTKKNKEESTNNDKMICTDGQRTSVRYFKNWLNTSKITDVNKYNALNVVNDDSENNSVNKNQLSTKKSKHAALKKVTIKKNFIKKENFVPNLLNQDAETISRQLANQGNLLAGNEEYAEAAKLFSRAISLLNTEYRYYGNRSFCYDRMKDYENALQDAEIAIHLSPSWAKGYFRKGRALAGLKRYTEAEKAYEDVLRLDMTCPETKRQLHEVRLANLMEMGFEKNLCELALRKTGCVQFALDELLSGRLAKAIGKEVYISDEDDAMLFEEEINKKSTFQKQKPSHNNEPDCKSLWIGNLVSCVSEKALENHFRQYGTIKSVKAIYDRHCAFINFIDAASAKQALKFAKTVNISGISLLVRYPEKNHEAIPAATAQTIECRFWRSTGCVFGSLCRYQHVPANKGIDCFVERTPYQSVAKC